jgi:hypothetical protein
MGGHITSLAPVITKINAIQGGTATLESITTQLEQTLDAARSGLSASYTPTVGAGETVVYEVTPAVGTVQVALSLRIDLTNMQAGDTLIIRKYLINISGGAYTLASADAAFTFANVQTVKMVELFENVYNTYGLKFVIVQSTGTARAFVAECIDAAAGI